MRRIDPVFDRDKFLLRQKHLAISEKYYVWDEQENPILYVERPRYMFLNLLAIFGGFLAGVIVFIVLFMLASVVSVEPFQRFIFYMLAGIGAAATSFIVAIALQKKRHVVFYRDDIKTKNFNYQTLPTR